MTGKRCLILFCLLFFSSCAVIGQVGIYGNLYRPAQLNWQQLKTPHFRIIFPAGYDSLARRSGMILENQYDSVQQFVGGSLTNFPVVLDSYNDLTNGFVSTAPFHSEVVLAPFKGKNLNPQSGDWMETVLPHELVHALHINSNEPKANLPGIIGLLSPDIRRTFHFWAPSGVHEGIATHYESTGVSEHGGRGNYPFFANQINARFAGSGPWSMGQTFIESQFTLPFNRHYAASTPFIEWLHETYGDDTSKEAIRFHYSYFFMGYGVALRQQTGKWPDELYKEFIAYRTQKEEERLSKLGANTTEKERVLSIPFKGRVLSRPLWISEDEIIFHGRFYNARQGLYTHSLRTGKTRLFHEDFLVRDYNYELSKDRNKLIYANYDGDPLFRSVFLMDVAELNIRTGKRTDLTRNKRVYAPTYQGGRVLALQTDDSNGWLVELRSDGSITVLKTFLDAIPVSLRTNPANPDQLAVIVNQRGVQGLWLVDANNLDNWPSEPNVAFKTANIQDPRWHPDGDRLLFTSDVGGVMNVYEYYPQTDEVVQLTQSLFNSLEADYSPDGTQLAYVTLIDNEFLLATLDREHWLNQVVSPEEWKPDPELTTVLNRPLLGSEWTERAQNWRASDYKADRSWVKPRGFFPTVREANLNRNQWGVGLFSTDILRSQTYQADLTMVENRLYLNGSYRNSTFFPGFQLRVFSEPNFSRVTQTQPDGTRSTLYVGNLESQGVGAYIPFSYDFRRDTRLTSLLIRPGIEFERLQFLDGNNRRVTEQFFEQDNWLTQFTGVLYTQYFHNILQFSRDAQPSAGAVFFAFTEIDFARNVTSLNNPDADGTRESLYAGARTFISPLRTWNQSLMLDARVLTQSDDRFFDNSTIEPLGFDLNREGFVIGDRNTRNIGRFTTRYTVPLIHPDDGFLTLPVYLSRIYLTGFTHTLTDLNADNWSSGSRTVFGAGLRFGFTFSNINFDIGAGFTYEPTRNNTQFILGAF
ncbi:MAG: hypothetical protein AAFW89_13870 [Bacteroidota bacterium]